MHSSAAIKWFHRTSLPASSHYVIFVGGCHYCGLRTSSEARSIMDARWEDKIIPKVRRRSKLEFNFGGREYDVRFFHWMNRLRCHLDFFCNQGLGCLRATLTCNDGADA